MQQLFGVAGTAAVGVPVFAADRQPHIEAALGALRTAMAELRAAAADKDGHRGKAMGFIKQAMDEIKARIDSAEPPPKTAAPSAQQE